jgi:hypothetical protein
MMMPKFDPSAVKLKSAGAGGTVSSRPPPAGAAPVMPMFNPAAVQLKKTGAPAPAAEKTEGILFSLPLLPFFYFRFFVLFLYGS